MALRFNTFRAQRYLRSRFVEGAFLLASEAGDIELEILDQLREQIRLSLGDVAIADAWEVSKLSDTQILIKPGDAWFDGLPFSFRSGKDQLVSGAVVSLGTVPLGTSIADDATGLGKIITFGTVGSPNNSETTPTNLYRIVVTAREELITSVQDEFLQNANLTESTAQKVRLNFQINIVPDSIQTESPIPYRDESSTGTLGVTNFPGTGDSNAPNFVNKIVVTPSVGSGDELSRTNLTGSEIIDGRDLEIVFSNPVGANPIPNGLSEQAAFSNGRFIDSVGTTYHINQIFNDVVSGQVVIRLDLEFEQTVPVITNGSPYTLEKRRTFYTDDVNGIPQGRLNWSTATLDFSTSNGVVHESSVVDLRNSIQSQENYQFLVNTKFSLKATDGGTISYDNPNSLLTWTAPIALLNPHGTAMTVAAAAVPILDEGSLIYDLDIVSGGAIEKGTVAVNATTTGTTITLDPVSLSAVSLGNVFQDNGGIVHAITDIDDVANTITLATSVSNTGAGTIYLDSFAAGTAPLSPFKFCLATRKGAKAYIAGLELEDGESGQIGDGASQELLTFVGSTGDADDSPDYASNFYVTDGQSLVTAISALDAGLDALAASVGLISWKSPVADFASLPTVGNVDGDVRLTLDSRIAYTWDNANTVWIPISGSGSAANIVGGGNLSWNATSGELAFDASLFVETPGLTYADNEILVAQSPVTLTGSQVAHVSPNTTGGGPNLAITVSDLNAVPSGGVVVARRDGSNVLVGGTLLQDGETKRLGATLSEEVEDRLYAQKSSFFRSDNPVTWTGTDLQFTTDLVLEMLKDDGTVQAYTVLTADSPLALADGEYAILTVDRSNNAQTLSFTNTTTPAEVGFDSEVIIFGKRVDALGIGYLHLPLHKQVLSPGQTVRLGASGAGGAGGAFAFEETLKNRLQDSIFEALTPYIAEREQETLIDTVASTGVYDLVSARFKLTSIGDTLVSSNLLDSEAKSGLGKSELVVKWDDAAVDTGATYEMSRNGGNEWQAITMERVDASPTYRGIIEFAEEAANQTISEEATTNTTELITDTTSQRIAHEFTLTSPTILRSLDLFLTKTGTPLGDLEIQIIADDSSLPSTNPSDIEFTTLPLSIPDLSAGTITTDLGELSLNAGTYHIVLKPSAAYTAEYTNSAGANRIEFDINVGGLGLSTFDGAAWNNPGTGSSLRHTLEGISLDLRVRITSSIADALLEGFGAFYEENAGNLAIATTIDGITRVTFNAVADNPNVFTLPFLANPDLLVVHLLGSGQSFRYGDFALSGNSVEFPVDQFNNGGVEKVQTLVFDQLRGGAFDNSDVNAALQAANHLGSLDATIDRSVAGRGRLQRKPDATLIEVTVNDDNEIEIYEVT